MVEIKNNGDMKREITRLMDRFAMARRSGEQIIIEMKFMCVRGDGIKMMWDLMDAVKAKFGTKYFVPMHFEEDTNACLGWAGCGYKSAEFHSLMERAIAMTDAPKVSAPAKSNAPDSVYPDPDEEKHYYDVNEDMESIQVDGEELWLGVKSGFIFRATENGDIKIGVAGQGTFKDIKIPPSPSNAPSTD